MSSTVMGALRRTVKRAGRAAIGIVLTGGLLLAHPAPAAAASPVAYDQTWFFQMDTPELLFLTGSDDDGDPLTYEVLTQPTHGTLTECADTHCRYTPQAGYVGLDSLTFRTSDGTSISNTATITIEVHDPGTGSTWSTSAMAAPGDPVSITLEGYDGEEQALAFTIVDAPSHGSLGALGPVTCDYVASFGCRTTVDYTADLGTGGLTDSFTFRGTDPDGHRTVPSSVTINIVDPSAPTAYDNFLSAGKDSTTTLTVSGADELSRDLTFAVVGSPTHGTLSAFHDTTCGSGFCEAKIDYTTAGYVGSDGFTFTVTAGTSTSTPATVTLDVNEPPCAGKSISNGTVKLGVNCKGELNVDGLGLQYVPTGNDSTSPGCACEGWGAGDTTSTVSGWANQSSGNSDNLTQVSFVTTDTTAVSVVDIGTTFRVTHDYHPSPSTPNAYEVSVSVKNISAAATHLRYRRVMDWDIEPTAFSEFVTLFKGSSPFLDFTSNDGFATSNPLAGPSDIGQTGSFTDVGPNDHGALFDFDFGNLAPGATREFKTFYGAAATETGAINALNAVGVEAYSLGEPSTPDGPTLGTPNTFLFGFRDIGGADVFAPNAVNDSLSTAEDTAGSVNVLTNDTDPNGDTLSVSSATNGAHGTVSCTGPGVCTYTPAANYNGPDSFTYTVSDGQGGTDTGTVNVTVTPVNDAPVAVGDSATTAEDTAKAVDVLANDSDVDGPALTASLVSGASHGTVSCVGATCTYTPAANYNGPDSFTYKASDGSLQSNTVTVSITVTPVNDAPDAVNDSASASSGAATPVAVLANDTDIDGDPLTVTGKTDGAHGAVTCTTTSCSYTSAGGYSGPDSFTYTISDGHGGTDTATVTMTVTSGNRPPVAADDSFSTPEDTPQGINVLGNDTDPDAGDTLNVSGTTPPSHGTVSCTPGGSCTYTPAANYNGPDSFGYTVSDGHGGSDTGAVSVTVTPVNDAPVAVADSSSTPEDTAKLVAVLGNDTDVDGPSLTAVLVTGPSHGTAACGATGCTYTPAANYSGPDSFTYRASDGSLQSAPVTVTMTVTPVNDAPDAVNDSLTTSEDTAGTIGVLANDTDVDGPSLSVTGQTNGAHGTATCTAAGSCTYTPAANYNGPDSFTYTLSDGTLTDIATVNVTVTPANDAPVAVADATTTAEDTAKTIAVTGNDTDVDGPTLSAVLVTGAAHGTVTCTAGSCTYTPAANYNGPDSFTYRASDGSLQSAPATVTITVTPVNDAPVAVDDTAATEADTPVDIDVLGNDTDPDTGDSLTVSAATDPAHGTVVCTDVGCTYTPDAGYTGEDTFSYTVRDTGTLTDTGLVTVSVGASNEPPEPVDDLVTTNEDTVAHFNVLTNDTDPEGDPLTVTPVADQLPTGGTVTCTTAGACTYTPDADFNGDDQFQYRVADNHGNTVDATVEITIVPVNDAPVAVNDTLTLKEDTTKSVTVLTNDDDVDGDALTVTGKSNGVHGTVTCTTAGSCTYKPAKDYNGKDSFTYTVSDGHGGTDVGTVNVTVQPVADRPGAPKIGDASSGAAGGTKTITCRWSAPKSDGGAPITAYKVSVQKLNAAGRVVSRSTFSAGATKRSLSVNRPDGRYLCRVSATNRVGTGPQSGASNIVRAR